MWFLNSFWMYIWSLHNLGKLLLLLLLGFTPQLNNFISYKIKCKIWHQKIYLAVLSEQRTDMKSKNLL